MPVRLPTFCAHAYLPSFFSSFRLPRATFSVNVNYGPLPPPLPLIRRGGICPRPGGKGALLATFGRTRIQNSSKTLSFPRASRASRPESRCFRSVSARYTHSGGSALWAGLIGCSAGRGRAGARPSILKLRALSNGGRSSQARCPCPQCAGARRAKAPAKTTAPRPGTACRELLGAGEGLAAAATSKSSVCHSAGK